MISKILNGFKTTQPKNINAQEKSKRVLLNVYKYRKSLDVTEQNFKEGEALANYKEFLKDRIKYPIIAEAALVKAQKEGLIVFQHMFDLHKNRLEQNPKIDMLIRAAENKKFRDYPFTVFLREKLIKSGRVNLDGVKPALRGWKKHFLRIKTWM